jgi:DNA modification methylase
VGDLVTLHEGDCLTVLATLPDSGIDAIVTDPPYGLEFMGREWDSFKPSSARIRPSSERDRQPGAAHNATTSLVARNTPEAYVAGRAYQDWCTVWARECLRVLKPGGFLLAFGGTRTYHRLACGIEDAGFEVRDSLHWIYGSGFPKSLDVGKAIDKAAGAEREAIGPNRWAGRYPNANHDRQGLVFADDDYVRPADPPQTAPGTSDAARWDGWGTALKPSHEPVVVARKPLTGTVAANVLEHGTGAVNIDACRVAHADDLSVYERSATSGFKDGGIYGGGKPVLTPAHDAGRWPPNVLLTHSECDDHDCAGDCPVAELDRQSGVLGGGAYPGRRGADRDRQAYGEFGGQENLTASRTDAGGASRFFPAFRYCAKAPASERPRLPDGTAWPTVKPLGLMRWLVRLVTPPGGTVLDPFAGTGTTGQAAALEGFRCVLVERDPVAVALARQRLARPLQPSLPQDLGMGALRTRARPAQRHVHDAG